jgi:hypothetical protein
MRAQLDAVALGCMVWRVARVLWSGLLCWLVARGELHLNVILPSTSGSPHWPLSLRFPHQHPVHPSLPPIRVTCPAHLILLDLTTRTILGKEYKSFSSSLCNFLHSPVTSSLLGPNTPLYLFIYLCFHLFILYIVIYNTYYILYNTMQWLYIYSLYPYIYLYYT